jgi:lactobin A/cerein 7B family class IIb bacteriocin
MDVLTKQFHRGAGHSLHKINYFINLNFVKMKNLKEFGVQEMDAKEMKKTDGGIIGPLAVAAAYAFWGAAFYGAFTMGYDAAQK